MGPTTKEKKELSLVEKWNEQMTLIEKKTGIHGVYVIILLVVSVLFVYLNIFDNLITNLVGTVYPAFWTMKSIETKSSKKKQKEEPVMMSVETTQSEEQRTYCICGQVIT